MPFPGIKVETPGIDLVPRNTATTTQGEGVPLENSNLWHKSLRFKVGLFFTLGLVTLTQAFDATCIAVTLPAIASDLDASVSLTLSLSSAFLLSLTVVGCCFAQFSNIVGRKPAYIAGILVFIGGTIMCGSTHNSLVLLIGRAVQGGGAGGTQALTPMILTDIFKPRERAKWMSYWNISWALGTISGPLLGGLFTLNDNIGWRWCFWINLPFLGIGTIGAWFMLGYDQPHEPWKVLFSMVDWTGMLLFVVSSVCFLLPLSWGGSRYSWHSAQVIAPMCVSILGFSILGVYERRYTKTPMFRPSVYGNYSTVLTFFNTMIHGMLMYMVLYYLSLYFLGVKALSPLQTGVWALPATVSVVPTAVFVGIIGSRTGSYRWFLRGGWVLAIVAMGLMICISVDSRAWTLVLITLLVGLALGVLIPAMSMNIQATVSNEDCGRAVSMIHVMRSAGQCLGVAVGLAVFSSRLEVGLRNLGFGGEEARNMMITMRHSLRNGGTEDRRLLEVVASALDAVWITGCALACLAGVLTIFIKCPRISPDDCHDEVGLPVIAANCPSAPAGDDGHLSRGDGEVAR
ncbi:hypothetical protein G7046_g6783 [Stylonectria norvegica]|nr:hypothetical protein G7046_g6783 [Stylonectria norvegica]